MTTYSSKDVAFLLIDGFSVLGFTTDLDDESDAPLEETTALGDTWPSYGFPGNKSFKLNQKGFYDTDTASVNEALVGQAGVSRVLTYGVEGNTLGKRFIGCSGAMQINVVRQAKLKEFHKLNASYEGNGAIDEGVILHPFGAETTASGNTNATPVDNGASSANGGALYAELSALALGGYTNLTLGVNHSADNVTYTSLLTAAAFTATGAKRATIGGTVNRYLSAAWSFSGTGTGESGTFMIGFARG